jgi:hypothetical protein
MGRSGVQECLDFLPPAPPGGFLSLFRRNARNPVRLFRSGVFLRLNLCLLLLHRRLAGQLEMPSMRSGIFPRRILSQPLWRPMLPL